MAFDLLIAGLFISLLGAAASIWIYWQDIKRLRLRTIGPDNLDTPLTWELWAVLLALTVAAGAPAYVYVHKTWPTPPIRRHLEAAQKERMRASLKLKPDERYEFQIDTSPSCDECEQFAEELRTFFSSIPGLQASGGPLIFAANYSRGVQFVTNGKSGASPGGSKLLAALQDAGIIVTQRPEPPMKDGDFTILIGRP
jgi:hypothetical protein